ncbi:hypothetical protein SDC9_132860 [bioreactor metagenome]|uniref:Uncharacterized protein n=1 Tax=bioreactor metagenome TaxID=1076179 RepID=A0A645D9C5_9ZZZZ
MVFISGMVSSSHSGNDRFTRILIVTQLVQIRNRIPIIIQILTIGITLSFRLTYARAHVNERLKLSTAEVYVTRSIIATTSINTRLQTSVITGFAVFLQHNVNDTGCAFGIIFGRRIGNYFHTFN